MSHKIWLEWRLDLNCINTWDSTLVGNGGGMSQWIDYGVHQSALRILPGPRGCQVHGDHLLGILRIERVLPARTGTRREGARELFQRHQWWAAKEGVIFWTPLVREGYASIKAYQHQFYEAQRMPVSCLLKTFTDKGDQLYDRFSQSAIWLFCAPVQCNEMELDPHRDTDLFMITGSTNTE